MRTEGPPSRRRADATRNAERIMAAAREAFEQDGPDVRLEEIARRAGVGPATLYRHFTGKDALIRAIVERRLTEDIDPAIRRALADPDPWHAFVEVMEAVLKAAEQESGILRAARDQHGVLAETAEAFLDSLWTITHRAQQAGKIRPDLTRTDLEAILTMLTSPLQNATRPTPNWRRYLTLLLEGLQPTTAAEPSARRSHP